MNPVSSVTCGRYDLVAVVRDAPGLHRLRAVPRQRALLRRYLLRRTFFGVFAGRPRFPPIFWAIAGLPPVCVSGSVCATGSALLAW